jgi:carbon-monoxide dehydrogenase medium subunit
MKPAPFELVQPHTVQEVISQLRGRDGMAKVMAGGQSLVPMLNLRLAPLELVIDLSRIAELKTVSEHNDAVVFGACVTHAAIEDGRTPDPTGGLMRRVAGGIAYRAVRNRGTIGGSVALADPSAEWVSLLVALDATIEAHGPDGARQIPARDFVVGAYMTVLDEEELLTALVVPKFSASARYGYYKMCRKTGEYANSLAIAVRDPDRQYCRLVVGATGGAPLILEQAQQVFCDAVGWSHSVERALRDAADADLAAAHHDFDDFAKDVHRASVLAAVKEALAP